MGLLNKLFLNQNDKELKKLSRIADDVIALSQGYAKKTDDELRRCTALFKERLSNGETLDDLLVEAYAVCTEAVKRVLGFDLYKVQIMGGIALHQGRIAEMLTGEGKTVVETLPAYLNALADKGVHIVTVNDYLADRDAGWMGGVYRFLGLTVGLIAPFQSNEDKKKAYSADITYGTNSEYGFDYLRDNMYDSLDKVCQRGHSFAIVDEVDSVLIDEARTPLIIAGQIPTAVDLYEKADEFAKTLVRSTYVPNLSPNNKELLEADGDFVIDEEKSAISLTSQGVEKAEKFFEIDGFSSSDTDVDEETSERNIELYKHIRFAIKANFLMKKDRDYVVIEDEVLIVDEHTGRIMRGRRYNEGLHQAIEAKEGVTIQGESSTFASVTYQNYFRLYDKLSGMSGTAKYEEREFAEIYGVDVVCIPPNKEVKRVDERDKVYVGEQAKLQAIAQDIEQCKQKGQPVLVGTPSVEKSERLSELLVQKGIEHKLLNAKNYREEAMIIAQAGRFGSITVATNMAGRGTDIVLGGNASFYAIKSLENEGYSPETIDKALHTAKAELTPEMAEITAKYQTEKERISKELLPEKDKVIQAGGLRVIGTEKNENRRIDKQLRGRSGRQGDVGSSIYYLSFEDDLLRIPYQFELNTYAENEGLTEDSLVQTRYVDQKIKNAQTDLEQIHYSMRKRILGFDDVLNRQRLAIYAERRKIMERDNVHDKILTYIPDYVSEVVQTNVDYRLDYRYWDYDAINAVIDDALNLGDEKVVTIGLAAEMNIDSIIDEVLRVTLEKYRNKIDLFSQNGYDFGIVEKRVLLKIIDSEWIDQMDNMDNLRSCVDLKALGQINPTENYQIEGMKFFDRMIDEIRRKSVQILLKTDIGEINKEVDELNDYPDEILDD